MKFFIVICLTSLLMFESCQPEENHPADTGGKLVLAFDHEVNNARLVTDSVVYQNEAGNIYGVNELRYFISDVSLYNRTGKYFAINDEKLIHYVDIQLSESLEWHIFDRIPTGVYDSICFIFGLNEERNQSFIFVNPPEVNMFWPDMLGGGYHYLMLNGKWKTQGSIEYPFDFHLGIGQVYSGTTTSVDSIIGFVHNYFRVSVPLNGMVMEDKALRKIQLVMDINSWFCTPNTWDIDHWGSYIMQNQAAMKAGAENGYDVFILKFIE